jgi:hypothetical protein
MAVLTAEPGLLVRQVWETARGRARRRRLLRDRPGLPHAPPGRHPLTREHDRRPAPPVPVRPGPRRGQTADSYLRRLADANHLRFTYLRRYLARPEGSYGPIDPGRIAALAGRELPAILHALPDLAPSPRPPVRRYTEEEVQRNHAAKGRSAPRSAATSATACPSGRSSASTTSDAAPSSRRLPPQTRQSARRSTASPPPLDGPNDHIDAMITTDLEIAIAAVWEHPGQRARHHCFRVPSCWPFRHRATTGSRRSPRRRGFAHPVRPRSIPAARRRPDRPRQRSCRRDQ